MRVRRWSLAALLVLSGLAACGIYSPDLNATRVAAGTVNGLCPVREQPVVPGVALEHDGQKIGFCCPPCKPEFLKKPESFVAAMRADREKFAYVGE